MDSDQNSQPLLASDRQSDSEDMHDVAADDEEFNKIRHRSVVIAATPAIVGDSSSGSHPGTSSIHSDINDSDTHEIRDLESNTDDGGDDDDDDTEQLFKATNTVPNDRFSFTYMVFYLLGMTTLLPWNFFITAEDVSANTMAMMMMLNRNTQQHQHHHPANEFNLALYKNKYTRTAHIRPSKSISSLRFERDVHFTLGGGGRME